MPQTYSLFIFVWVTFSAFTCSVRGQACYAASECASQSVINSVSDGSSDIECYGYKSCYQATVVRSTGTAQIHCDAAFSCYDAQSIERPSTTNDRDINCM